MDLGNWLRKRKDDVNKRWQNSVILDAVSSGTQADKARRAQQGPQTVNQQAAKTYGSGFSAPVNRVRDLFDANTQADAMKRLASTGLNESYQDQQNRLTNEAVNTQSNRSGVNQFAAGGLKGFVNRVTKAPGDIGNLVGAAANTNVLDNVPVVGNLARLNKVTGNKFGQQLQDTSNQRNKVIDQKINQSQIGERKGDNRLITGAGQVITDLPFQAATGGAGLAVIGANTASDEYNRAREAGKSNDAALNIGILQGGASALSEKVGMDRFLPGNGVTGNVLQKAANRFITEGAQEGQQQFTQNLIANKSYNPNQSLKEGVAESALLGALAGGVASPALDYASNVGAPPQVKQDVVRQNPVLQQTGIPAQPGSIRERIQMAKEAVTNKVAAEFSILKNNQDGFIQLPGGREVVTNKPSSFPDFQEDVNLGRISDNVETVPRSSLQKGPGTAGTGIDQARVQEIQQMIRDDVPIPPMITDPTGKLINDGQNRQAAFAREGITDVPIVREIAKKPISGAAQQSQLAKQSKKDPLDSLKQEARKYKSAEEFVKAQGEPVYHRSQNKFDKFDISKVSNDSNRQRYGWGLYFSDTIPHDQYGKHLYEAQAPKGTLIDTKKPVDEKIVSKIVDAVKGNNKNPSELDEFSYNGYLFYKTLSRILGGDKEASLFLSKNGIDGLKSNIGKNTNDYILFNDKSIKTKQQLTDLYNQANEPLDEITKSAMERASVKEYLKNKPVKEGDATTGEGAQLPGEGMTPKQRQSFIDRVKNSKLMKDDAGSINNKTTAQERIDAKAQVAKTEYKYKNTSANGTIRFNELNSKNSFQDINGERHPYQSDAKITVRNLDGTNETKTFSVKDIGSQKYFNDQLVRLGERGQVISAVIDQSPALAKTDLPTRQTKTTKRVVKPPVQDLPSVANRIAESQKQSQSEQSPVLPQEIQSTDTSAPRSSNKASATPNTANDTTTGDALTPKTYAETFGVSETQAKQDLASEPKFEAATRTEKSADANKLFESMKTDAKLTQATKEAQASGKEMNFYAKKDSNDRSVGIEQFNPKVHRIEAGFVVDEKGNVLGNHIKVDENGIQVNIGGKVTNMESVIGNPLDWGSAGKVDKTFKGRYKLSETMNRNIDNNAPNKKIANQTKTFLWSNKVKAEANMRTELDAEYKKLGDRIKKTNKAKPLGVSKQQYQDDIFAVLNGDKTDAQIKSEYDAKPAEAILAYKAETRTLYDSLLARVNTERIKFGQQPIDARKDYITHLQELNQNKGFVADVYGQMKNSFADEGMGKTRDGVPGEIAGRTENFKPISKYNPFLQRRTGTKSLRDPYAAVQEYLQPALYNIHMTESGARARAIETAFRTAEAIKNTNPQSVLDEAKKITDKYKGSSDNAKLIAGFQEYANALAGKTQRFDRQVVDSSDAAAKGLKGWQFLQRTGGRATIVGNASSVLAQPLNQVVGLADAGPVNYMKGVAASIAGDPAIEKSDFIKARATEPTKAIRTKGEKVMDGGGVPLQAVELASVKLMWHTQHQKALSNGYKGQEAIQQADLNTERLVAGRGIADKPELYRSTVANGVLQYTLEVSAQNKAFWQDLSPKQKATFLVGATATNTLMGAITGFEPLPDFLKALFDTGKELLDKEDERNPLVKVVKGGQRVLGEYASMNPLISGAVNTVLSDGTKKTIFGADSDLGRFPGETAPAGVIKNAVNAGSSLVKGDYRNARDSVFKIVPMGNQIRKTTQGAETLMRGYAVDAKGERTFDAPTSPFQKGRTLLFGPSASTQASNYYDEKDQGLTKDQREQLRDAPPERRDEFKKQLLDQNKIADKQKAEKESNLKDKGSVTSKVDAINKESEARTAKLKASLSPDDYEISNMTKEEKKKVVAAGIKTQAELDGLENFVKNKKKELGISTSQAKDLPKNINGTARKILDDENINDTEWLKKPNKDKDISNAFKSWLPKDIQSPPVNNEIAKDWANYEKKKAEGSLGKLEDESERKTILKKAYNSQLNEDERDLYSLSETRLKDSYNRGLINDQNINKALAVEKQLYDAGLIDKESLAKKLDLTARGYKGSGSSRSKAQNNINSLTSDTLSRLNKLLAGTSKPVTGQKKVATKKPVLKKITVRS